MASCPGFEPRPYQLGGESYMYNLTARVSLIDIKNIAFLNKPWS